MISPCSGTIAFGLFLSVQHLVLDTDDPLGNAKRYIPGYIFLVGFVISMVTLIKGLRHVGLEVSYGEAALYATGIGLLTMAIGFLAIRKIRPDEAGSAEDRIANLERLFGVLMIFTACSMAFAHGSNDVANAIGPLAAVNGVVQNGGAFAAQSELPFWTLLLGGALLWGLRPLGIG